MLVGVLKPGQAGRQNAVDERAKKCRRRTGLVHWRPA
jgi:hypothetical protein